MKKEIIKSEFDLLYRKLYSIYNDNDAILHVKDIIDRGNVALCFSEYYYNWYAFFHYDDDKFLKYEKEGDKLIEKTESLFYGGYSSRNKRAAIRNLRTDYEGDLKRYCQDKKKIKEIRKVIEIKNNSLKLFFVNRSILREKRFIIGKKEHEYIDKLEARDNLVHEDSRSEIAGGSADTRGGCGGVGISEMIDENTENTMIAENTFIKHQYPLTY